MNLKWILGALFCSIVLGCSRMPTYDIVINNGKVLDYSTGKFVNLNIGITNNRIEALSKKVLVGQKSIDATDEFIYPGFIDAHCHFVGYANSLSKVNLVGTQSYSEVIQRVKEYHIKNPDIHFIEGRGWDQNDWENKDFPNNTLLNEAFPDIPVYLKRIDGHAALINNKALEMISDLPETIVGGEIKRNDGLPTGLFIDKAMSFIQYPENKSQDIIEYLKLSEENCFKKGLTGLADAGLSFKAIGLLDSLFNTELLSIPIYAMLSNSNENNNKLFKQGAINHDRLKVRSIKVYSDGALGSRGAHLLQPYTDDSLNSGLEITSYHELLKICEEAKKANIQINVHAIGDSANRMVLNVFAKVLKGKNDMRWRVEHAQIIAPKDSVYFIEYSIIPSVQPTHATSDMYWAEERIGAQRIKHAYSYASLQRWSSNKLPLGTDFPVEDIDPLKTFYAAVSRKDSLGFPEDGFLPEQKLKRIDALRGMTIWAAFAQFQENETGSIETGKWADIVFSKTNLLECDENEILKTKITRTILRGEIVFEVK